MTTDIQTGDSGNGPTPQEAARQEYREWHAEQVAALQAMSEELHTLREQWSEARYRADMDCRQRTAAIYAKYEKIDKQWREERSREIDEAEKARNAAIYDVERKIAETRKQLAEAWAHFYSTARDQFGIDYEQTLAGLGIDRPFRDYAGE